MNRKIHGLPDITNNFFMLWYPSALNKIMEINALTFSQYWIYLYFQARRILVIFHFSFLYFLCVCKLNAVACIWNENKNYCYHFPTFLMFLYEIMSYVLCPFLMFPVLYLFIFLPVLLHCDNFPFYLVFIRILLLSSFLV